MRGRETVVAVEDRGVETLKQRENMTVERREEERLVLRAHILAVYGEKGGIKGIEKR